MNNSRERILYTALELFATQGFAKTSTRQIAEKAKVNLSSIKYYFGDKEGLYLAAFHEPMKEHKSRDIKGFFEGKDLTTGMKEFFLHMLLPLMENHHIQLCLKLHLRETLEPTGAREREINDGIKPHHELLSSLLMKEFGLEKKDSGIDRLVFSIMSMPIFIYMAHDVITRINSGLVEDKKALQDWAGRLGIYAVAMIEAEKKIRQEINE